MMTSSQTLRSTALPTAILGFAATAVCFLLLLLPAGRSRTLGEVVAEAVGIPLYYLSSDLYYSIDDSPMTWQLLLLTVVLVVIPVLRVQRRSHRTARDALEARRSGRRDRSGRDRPTSDTPRQRSSQGHLLEDRGSSDDTIERTRSQLRRLAREAGVPWDDHFGSPGGARVLIEIAHHRVEGDHDAQRAVLYTSLAVALRAVTSSLAEDLRTMASASAPDPTPVAISATVTSGPVEEPPGAAADVDVPPTEEEPAELAETTSDQPSIGAVGSVYTSTTLYRSATAPADGTGEER